MGYRIELLLKEAILLLTGKEQFRHIGQVALVDENSTEETPSLAIKDMIFDQVTDNQEQILHLIEKDAYTGVGEYLLALTLNYQQQLRLQQLLRSYIAYHLFRASLPYDITGRVIQLVTQLVTQLEQSHLDFDTVGEAIDKVDLEADLSEFVARDHPIFTLFMRDNEFIAKCETMYVVACPDGNRQSTCG